MNNSGEPLEFRDPFLLTWGKITSYNGGCP